MTPSSSSGKLFRDAADAFERIKEWKREGHRIVFTNGCFDILHPGHIDLLSKAADQGDRLIVGLNSDLSVKRLEKGPERPLVDERSRALVLTSLEMVDGVVIFEEDTPFELIQLLRPDVLVKGGDYEKEEVVGREIVERNGGQVVLIPLLEGYSTSSIVERILGSRKKG